MIDKHKKRKFFLNLYTAIKVDQVLDVKESKLEALTLKNLKKNCLKKLKYF